MSSTHDSVTEWLNDLKHSGDPVACQRIWQRYVAQLVRVAHRKLRDTERGAADEEDVAVAAFASFFRGVAGGQFACLNDRDDLWQILLMLTERKALNQIRHERAKRRGGAHDRGGRPANQASRPPTDSSSLPIRVRHPSSPPKSAINCGVCWSNWTTLSCVRSCCRSSKVTRTGKLPGSWTSACGASSGGWH